MSGNMSDSDDDSSDSDFGRGFTHNDELTASFFSIEPVAKSNLADSKDDSEDQSTDDDNFTSIPECNSIETFSEVVRNLEATQRLCANDENSEQHPSTSDRSLQVAKRVKTGEVSNAISDEINAVLLQGESGALVDDEDANDENEKEDIKPSAEYTIPKEGVKITLPGTSLLFRKKPGSKKESDLAAILRRKLKTHQIFVDKVSRLCWLAHGFHLNHQANDPMIMTAAVSLISTNNYPKDKFDLVYLANFTKWFRNIFVVEPSDDEVTINKQILLKRIAEKIVFSYRELVVLYVAILRGIGLNCRLIVSLNPPPVKAYNDLLPKASTVKKSDKSNERETKMKASTSKEDTKAKSSKEDVKVKSSQGESKTKSSKKDAKLKSSKEDIKNADSKKDLTSIIQNSESARKEANLVARKRAAEIFRSKYSYKKKSTSKLNDNQNSTVEVNDNKSASTSSGEVNAIASPRYLRSGKPRGVAQSATIKQNDTRPSKNNPTRAIDSKKKSNTLDSSSEEKEEEELEEKPLSKVKRKRGDNKKASVKPKQKVKQSQESDEEDTDNSGKLKERQNVWAEVYVESKGSWISVNVMDSNVDCVAEIYKKASRPVLYVIAYNSEGLIKDVTRRYCSHWLSVTRKQRIDEKWWTETLSYWLERETAISRQEDDLLLQKELEQPLPKTVGECKGHPLYVLLRHLLKYEGLYPPDCVPLGHLPNGEAIYSRYCVHTLCSRETWLKKARVVKPKQEPYKIVKALPKYDKLSGMKLKDSALELFGEWQTTEYVPPEAKDGIVPRNEYGNVDLFKKCMLPKGTVHINLPGLNRIARKLNIDCATAVVGFNFGCMGAVPAIEGFVVCAEYEDTLRDAWETEQAEAAKRTAEKREKRIYGNWRKLIKGLLIREKLSQKYEFLSEPTTDRSKKRPKQRKTIAKKPKV